MMTNMKVAVLAVLVLGAGVMARGAGLADAPTARAVLSLDGVWNFATDPDARGEAEKWYLPSVKLPAMPLPGYLAADKPSDAETLRTMVEADWA